VINAITLPLKICSVIEGGHFWFCYAAPTRLEKSKATQIFELLSNWDRNWHADQANHRLYAGRRSRLRGHPCEARRMVSENRTVWKDFTSTIQGLPIDAGQDRTVGYPVIATAYGAWFASRADRHPPAPCRGLAQHC